MPESLSREQLIRSLPDGAKISFDGKIYVSLDSVIRMMDEVVESQLCENTEKHLSSDLFSVKSEMREDRAEKKYSRDEMLSCSEFRSGNYTVVPKLIEQEN